MDARATELRERAADLRSEAFLLLDAAGVLDVIRTDIGPTEVVGSVDLDLMVWPDIDLYTCLSPDEGQRLLALLPVLHERLEAQGYGLVRANFNDEYRRPGNPYGRGLYCGLKIVAAGTSRVWKLDLWAWNRKSFDEQLAEHRQLTSELSKADRDIVLQIKDAVHQRQEYRDTITSLDVYSFAIRRRGRTLREFDQFMAEQRKGDKVTHKGSEGANRPHP